MNPKVKNHIWLYVCRNVLLCLILYWKIRSNEWFWLLWLLLGIWYQCVIHIYLLQWCACKKKSGWHDNLVFSYAFSFLNTPYSLFVFLSYPFLNITTKIKSYVLLISFIPKYNEHLKGLNQQMMTQEHCLNSCHYVIFSLHFISP